MFNDNSTIIVVQYSSVVSEECTIVLNQSLHLNEGLRLKTSVLKPWVNNSKQICLVSQEIYLRQVSSLAGFSSMACAYGKNASSRSNDSGVRIRATVIK